jgi:hypothetical protein
MDSSSLTLGKRQSFLFANVALRAAVSAFVHETGLCVPTQALIEASHAWPSVQRFHINLVLLWVTVPSKLSEKTPVVKPPVVSSTTLLHLCCACSVAAKAIRHVSATMR